MKVYRVSFKYTAFGGGDSTVPLWVIARSVDEALRKGRSYAKRTFDPGTRPKCEGAVLVGTIDVP